MTDTPCPGPKRYARDLEINRFYPSKLRKIERELVRERRRKAREGRGSIKGNLRGTRIGFACSGGGIRSATFCLGFFQGLAKLRDRYGGPLHLLKQIDFLSTVSGGGYFGGFFGRLVTRGKDGEQPGIESAEKVLERSQSPEIKWLREHGRYISPTGAGDSLVAIAVFLRNWLTLHLILGASFFLLFHLVNTARSWLKSREFWSDLEAKLEVAASTGIWWSPSIALVVALLVLVALPLGWAYWLAQRDPSSAVSHTPIMATAILVLTCVFMLDLADLIGLAAFKGWEVLVVPAVFIPAVLAALGAVSLLRGAGRGRMRFRLVAVGVVVVGALVLWRFGGSPLFEERVAGIYVHSRTFEAGWIFVLFLVVAAMAMLIARKVERLDKALRKRRASQPVSKKRRRLDDLDTAKQARLVLGALVLGADLVLMYVSWALADGRSLESLVLELGASKSAIGTVILGVSAALALVYWILATQFALRRSPDDVAPSVRNYLSIWLSKAGLAIGVVLVFALVDSLGQSLYVLASGGGKWLLAALTSLVASAAAFATVARALADLVRGGSESKAAPRFRVPLELLAGLASLTLWGSLMVLYATASHAVVWRFDAGPEEVRSGFEEVWREDSVAAPLRVGVDGAVKALAPRSEVPAAGERAMSAPRSLTGMGVILVLLVGFLQLVSRNLRFVNFSSHQKLFAARLIRSYLGASNPERRKPEGRKISQSIEGDDVPFDDYAPHEAGGPLHLLSVTVNETIDGRSQIEQRDRKGLPMCLGPAGMSAGLRYHANWSPTPDKPVERPLEIYADKPDHATRRWVEIEPIEPVATSDEPAGTGTGGGGFHLFGPKASPRRSELVERLSLGDWLSISGAAFSTGLGAKTSLALTSLMGFINLRLGYWWDSGIDPAARAEVSVKGGFNRLSRGFSRLLPAHAYLLDEVTARFHGPNRRRWYLSDGGHFENTACYELLRRRVPMIVVLDCGADPEYEFSDLANLVRKARIDFDAEITFLSQTELTDRVDPDISRYFGTPAQMRRQALELKQEEDEVFHGRSYSRKHAALAQVRFPEDKGDEPTTEILWIKPSLVGDEAIDLRNYHGDNPAFPQETTADQFFDEAQWESYRKLGERIAEKLFYDDTRPEESWTPLRWFQQKRRLCSFHNPEGTETTAKRDFKSQE